MVPKKTRSCLALTSDDMREIYNYFGLFFSTTFTRDDLCYRLAEHMMRCIVQSISLEMTCSRTPSQTVTHRMICSNAI